MSTGWSVMDALNKSSRAAGEEKPKARFRTKDISIERMYSNDKNFYSMTDIGELADKILMCGMLENMTVTFAPCERGEYKIIAGERRFRALRLLVDRGFSEFEIATCQVRAEAEEHEEMVQIIIANAYRDKTIGDMLEEEKQLKDALQYMKKNKMELQGFSLESGRLRDVIAAIMQTTPTKVAQIESINKRLIPEFAQRLKDGKLTFSAAYEISGMQQDRQKELLEQYGEEAPTWKEVKEQKAAEGEKEEGQQAAGRPGDDYEQAHPEGITSICYSCTEYETCNVKSATCTKCDLYRNREEANKTEEQRYNEEQDAIDRETKKKLKEQQEKESGRQQAADETEEKEFIVSQKQLENIKSGKIPYMITAVEPGKPIKQGELIRLIAYQNGEPTGDDMQAAVTVVDDSETSQGIVEGYAVIGIMDIYDAEQLGLVDLEDME